VSAAEPSAEEPSARGDADAIAEVKQLAMWPALKSLSYVFWIVGAMEMVERFAFYGVATVRTIYATTAADKGGLGVSPSSVGNILLAWALVQMLVPVATGGLSDRYGYKETIFASTIIKLAGYLVMAFFPTYGGFFGGAMLLAFGTAIFKPGIQGTLIKSTTRDNSSMAWGVFYQTVNIGGWIGPVLAGHMRQLAWRNVFLACAAVICLNFLLLLTYKEPGKAERLAEARAAKEAKKEQKSLWRESLRELKRPYVWSYLLIFSGFWFMLYSLYDVLPNHIQDWVDTRGLVASILRFFGDGVVTSTLIVMNKQRTEILPEGMINIDAALIMTTCFLFAALSGKMKATRSMVLGTVLASFSMVLFGRSPLASLTVVAIAVFAAGEMLSSPKFSEFIGNIAPSDKKAMYIGFSQIPIAIGSSIEGKVGPTLYEALGSKEVFARQMLLDKGIAADLAAVPEGKAFDKLVEVLHQDRWAVTRMLHDQHAGSIEKLWLIMGGVGLASAIGIWLYGRWLERRLAAARS
jgi:proton-dependent oligopeptide transporter, POT family